MTPDFLEREHFYGAAMIGLRAIESDERLASVLAYPKSKRATLRERIETMCASAAGYWPEAFAPAVLFGLDGDEAFGPEWEPLPARELAALWKSTELLTREKALRAICRRLNVRPYEMRGRFVDIGPSTNVLVGGLYATWQTAEHFFTRPELSWTKQVTIVAARPTELQLAGLVAPLMGDDARSNVMHPLQADDFPTPDVRLWSQDANDDVAKHIRPPRESVTGG